MFFKWRGETRERFTEQPKGTQYMYNFQCYHKDFVTVPNTCTIHDVREFWRNQSYSALHYQQEQFEKNVQEHRRVAYEEVEIAASLAASRTAAKMPPRLRDIENNTEANVNQQQRILSEITSESAQAVGAQRQSLIHEATAEMMRRQPHQEAVVSQFRSELQHYYHPLESPSEEFQQSQAELRMQKAHS